MNVTDIRHVVDGVVGLGARDRQGQDHGQRTVRVPGILSHPVKVHKYMGRSCVSKMK